MGDATIHTADVVLFGRHDGELSVLLIERGWDPFKGLLALPGGHVDPGEMAEQAAHRELAEETGVRVGRLDWIGVYDAPGRDPRGAYSTTVFGQVLGHLPPPTAGDDAAAARWVLVDEALATATRLAFDHKRIIHDALRVLI